MKRVEIKEYIEDNNPKGLLEALGNTLEEVISSKKPRDHGCKTNDFELLSEHIDCVGVLCEQCPFDTTFQHAIDWLSQK